MITCNDCGHSAARAFTLTIRRRQGARALRPGHHDVHRRRFDLGPQFILRLGPKVVGGATGDVDIEDAAPQGDAERQPENRESPGAHLTPADTTRARLPRQ